jgi:flagellar hook-associated protein 3 FlgL
MRVTANTFPNSLIDQLGILATRQNRLQSQAATGQRIQLPEDDPTAMRRVLDLKAEGKTLAQYQRNISILKEFASASYNAMSAIKHISDRAGEIATLADGTKSPDQLKTYAIEINQMLMQSVELSNSKHRGDYIFGGTQTDRPPFELAPADADGLARSVAYQGNTTLSVSEIAESSLLTTQVLGANTTGAGSRGLLVDSSSGSDLFQHLIDLRDHLFAGEVDAIATTDRTNLLKDEENLLFHVGTNGAIQARLDTAKTIAETRNSSISSLVSNEADADLAQTLVQLSETQNAYRAALQSGATILNRSLMDFLR